MSLDFDTLADVLLDVRSLDGSTVSIGIVLGEDSTFEGATDQVCRVHTLASGHVTTSLDELLEVDASDLILEVESLPVTPLMVLFARFDNLQSDTLIRVTVFVFLLLDVKDLEDVDASGHDRHIIWCVVKIDVNSHDEKIS
jgi:hypothetical protein